MAWPQRTDMLTYGDQTKSLADWAAQASMDCHELSHRLLLHSMDIGRALHLPDPNDVEPDVLSADQRVSFGNGFSWSRQRIAFQGETRTLKDWCTKLGFKDGTIADRLKKGATIEQALTTPVQVKKSHNKKRSETDDKATNKQQCVHPATDTTLIPGGGSELLDVIGDRRRVVPAIENEIGVFA